MASKGEIITLQFGHYANHVGTHFWNLQENSFSFDGENRENTKEINHDVLYREGINNNRQVTYTPRVLIVDLKGSLGAISSESELYEPLQQPDSVNVEWDAKIEIEKSETRTKNEFQQDLEEHGTALANKKYSLDDEVKDWSDYLYSRFHSRSINVVREYQHSENYAFDAFPLGTNVWKSENFEDKFCDKIRNYIEECDFTQGFQIFHDATNAFSGMASSCMSYLNDEYGKAIFDIPLIPSFYDDYTYSNEDEKQKSILKDSTRVLNLLFGFNALKENCSIFAPLCTSADGWRQPGIKREFHHTQYKANLWYHSSAILAAAIDTFSLKYRLNSGNYVMRDLVADLTAHNRKAVCGSVCFPFSINVDCDLLECLDNWTGPLTQSITPSCSLSYDEVLYTLRGIPEHRLKKVGASSKTQNYMPAYEKNTIKDMLEFYLYCNACSTSNNVVNVEKSLSVKTPFPKIFDKRVGYNGNIIGVDRPDDVDVVEVPVMAGLHNGPPLENMLQSLHDACKKIKFSKFHQFISAGLEVDDFKENLDGLLDFRECYVNDNFL